MGGDHASEGGRQHQDEQPGDALLRVGPDAGAEIGRCIVIRQNGRHLLHILGGLVGQNVDCIVDGDDADEHALVVQDRHGREVVALHLTGHILLIVRDLHGNDVVVHDVGNGGLGVCQQQAAGRHNAQQTVPLDDVVGVDRLCVLALTADGGQRIADVHLLAQTDVFGRHQTAGRAFGVVQQLIQALTGLLGRFLQHPLHNTGGHIFQQVGGVVQAHLLDGADQLHIRERIDEVIAGLIGHIGKGLGRHFLFQQAEDHQTVVFVQFFQQLGQVGGLLFLGDFAQLDILLFHQHFQQAALGQHFGVGLDLFVTGLFFFGVPHILLEVFGGLLAQVFGQLPADFRRDICGQFGHRERCFRGRALFFFQFHLCSSLPFPADRTAHKTKSAACFPQRAVLPAARTRLRPFSPLRSTCTAPLTGQKRRTQLLSGSAVPQLIRVFDYDPGPLSCVHLLKILSTLYYSVRKKTGQP